MREDTQAATHVQLPDDVGRSVVLEDFILIRTVVRAITETLRVETSELALGGDVVQPVPFHVRRTGRRRQQKLSQTSLYSRSHVLPEELAILRLKCHEHAGVFLVGGVHVPCVVGAHIDRIAAATGRPWVSFPNATLQTMFRPVVVSQSTGGLPVWTTVVWSGGAPEGAGTTCDATGAPDLIPAIRLNAHSASSRNAGSSAAALSASRADCAFGPMLPRAPAAKIRT